MHMTLVLIAIFSLAFALLAWKKIEWAALSLAALLPLYLIRFSIGVPLTLLEAMILILFAVWFIKNFAVLRERLKKLIAGKTSESQAYPFRWEVIAWLIISFVAVGIAGWTLGAFGIWRAYFFEPLLLFIVFISVFNAKEKLIRLIMAFGLSAAGIALFALYQYMTGDLIPNEFWARADNRRATSVFPYPNAVGLYLAPIIPLLLGAGAMIIARGKSLFTRRWQVALLAGLALLALAGIIAARSDGALFALAGCVSLFGLIAGKKLRSLTLALVIAGAVTLAFVPALQHYVLDRALLRDFSGQVRRAQWSETWAMLSDGRLITGAGLDAYQSSIAPYHQEGIFVKDYRDPDFQRKVVFNEEFRNSVWQPLEIYLYPHNIILNFWTELGLAGVLVFISLSAVFFTVGWRSYRAARRADDPFAYVILGLMLSLVAMIIHGLVDVPYFKNDLAAMFWIIMAMMGVVAVGQKEKNLKINYETKE